MRKIDWADVRRRVTNLAGAPAAAEVFGYNGHRFVLEPVLRPDELAEVETQLNVVLPEDYREFLLNVGRGGAGPAYGVFPLRRADDGRWHWVGDGADMTALNSLDRPFPVQGPDPAVLDALRAERPEEEDFPVIEDFDVAYEAWEERLVAVLGDEARTMGAICICHLGCARREWLVVSGPERGNIWADDRVDDIDLYPLTDSGSRPDDGDRVTFGAWYLEWLEQAEAKART
ncbi:hypothetical protein GCM10023196_085960 [Actinoallomurus vinaceus]|uniref:Knr4/Smi1-like domain-containing protein n=1 Tax=Actinoallomurus vinaceus TaxID=1080074 RepID=A0ABP8UP12_9ACTN